MSKGIAFLTGIALMTAFGLLEIILPGRSENTMRIISAIGTLTGAYIGLQIANNGVRGLTFNQELYRMENPPPEDGKQLGGGNEK
jgi:hypothetical protein